MPYEFSQCWTLCHGKGRLVVDVVAVFIRFILILSIAFYSSFTYSSPRVSEYFDSRDRLFSLPLSERYTQLVETAPFDLNTPEGRYFYNVILLDSNASDLYRPLTRNDVRELQRHAPELALEYELVEMRLSDADSASRLAIINSVIQRAKESGYQRLARFATSDKVSVLLDRQEYKQAIETILSVIDTAPDIDRYMTISDYPLPVIYKDLADAFFMDSQPQTSIYYCQRYADYLANDEYVQFDAKLCKARALLSLNDFTKVIQEAYPVLEQAAPLGYDHLAIAGSLYIAKANVGLGHFDIAVEYAKSALTVMAQKNLFGYGDELYLSLVLAQAYNGLMQPDDAIRTISALREKSSYIQETPRFARMLLEVEAEASLLKQNLPQAIDALQQIIAIDSKKSAPTEQALQTPELLEKLNQNHLDYLQSQFADIEQRNKIVLAVSIVAIVCVIFLAGALYRSKRTRTLPRSYGEFDVYTNSLQKLAFTDKLDDTLRQTRNANEVFCLARVDVPALEDIKKQGRPTWEASLHEIATIINDSVEVNDSLCRLDGNEFAILLPTDYLHDATRKLRLVGDKLASQHYATHIAVLEFVPALDSDTAIATIDTFLQMHHEQGVISGRVSSTGSVKPVVIAHT